MKATGIMVMLTVPIELIPQSELDAVRRFLTVRVRGLNVEHHRRWLRVLKRLAMGEVQNLMPLQDRDYAYHARHMTIEDRIFENQDGFAPTEAGRRAFRNWVKCGASLVTLELHGGEPRWLPGSLSYDELSDDEFREFHEAAIDFLRTPAALKKLWPAVKAAERHLMLEPLLTKPKPEENT